jgi:hypothetical protein
MSPFPCTQRSSYFRTHGSISGFSLGRGTQSWRSGTYPMSACSGGCRMRTEGLNNEDLELQLEINGYLRLSNRGPKKKSGSVGGGYSPDSPSPLNPPMSMCVEAEDRWRRTLLSLLRSPCQLATGSGQRSTRSTTLRPPPCSLYCGASLIVAHSYSRTRRPNVQSRGSSAPTSQPQRPPPSSS